MADSTKTTDKVQPDKTGFFNSPAHLSLLVVIFLILLLGGLYVSQNRQTQTTTTTPTQKSIGPSLSLSSDKTEPVVGETFSIDVWEDSSNETVNAVQTKISYPADSLKFVSIDSTKSAFEIQAQANAKNGTIIIARAHKGSLTGRQIVASIKFKVLSAQSSVSLEFLKGSYLVSSINNQDILSKNNQTTSLNLNLRAK